MAKATGTEAGVKGLTVCWTISESDRRNSQDSQGFVYFVIICEYHHSTSEEQVDYELESDEPTVEPVLAQSDSDSSAVPERRRAFGIRSPAVSGGISTSPTESDHADFSQIPAVSLALLSTLQRHLRHLRKRLPSLIIHTVGQGQLIRLLYLSETRWPPRHHSQSLLPVPLTDHTNLTIEQQLRNIQAPLTLMGRRGSEDQSKDRSCIFNNIPVGTVP